MGKNLKHITSATSKFTTEVTLLQVNLEAFGKLCHTTHMELHELFDFMLDNKTVHAYLGHGLRAVKDNKG